MHRIWVITEARIAHWHTYLPRTIIDHDLPRSRKTPNGVGATPTTNKCWRFVPVLGNRVLPRPEAVFEWAKKHSNYRDLRKVAGRLIDNAAGMELLDAVLNRPSFEGVDK